MKKGTVFDIRSGVTCVPEQVLARRVDAHFRGMHVTFLLEGNSRVGVAHGRDELPLAGEPVRCT